MDDKKRIQTLEAKMDAIRSIQQLPATATLQEVIAAVNKITNSLKRRT